MLSRSHPRETLYQLPTYDQRRARTVLQLTCALLIFDLAASLLVASSWLARRWGYAPGLGRPWLCFSTYPQLRLVAAAVLASFAAALLLAFRRTRAAALLGLPLLLPLHLAGVWPLYPLFAYLQWAARFHHLPPLAPALDRASALLLASFGLLSAITGAQAAARLRGLRETGDTHGSSHWASPREVRATGLLQPAGGVLGGGLGAGLGVCLGGWRDPRGRLRRLADTRDRHVLAFAPSGSGKTTCLVIPTLFAWRGSIIALDVKGELWRHTAGYRRMQLGQACIRFDPSCSDGTAAAYNPLLVIPRGPGDVKYAQSVADVLIDPEGRDRPRSFWDQAAHSLLVAVILHVLHGERDKSLAGCAGLLCDPERPAREVLEAMLEAKHDPACSQGWRQATTGSPTATHPVVAAAARALLDMDPRTGTGVIATAQARLDLFRDPLLAANTAASDFTAGDLVRGERPVTLYLTISPAELERLRPVLRILLNQLCRQLTEHMDFHATGRPRHALLLLLDEFAALGKLDFFGRAMAYLRGFGIRVFLSIQSLSQLNDVYGEHQSITANCPVQVAFAPADVETAELLSRMTGPMTVAVNKRSLAGSLLALTPRRATVSRQEVARPLLTAEEVRRLPDGEALVFTAGHPAIRAARLPYFRDPVLAPLAAIACPAESDRIGRPSPWPSALPE
jgi:type IV secretion system protein VirD4